MHTTRFAPSPTGLLHLGHAFAALRAFEAARGGTFLLRIEDLDSGRVRPEYATAIEEDLAWLGLSWKRPVLHQSTRLQAYRHALATLLERQLLYPCFCTRKEIALEIARAGYAPHQSDYVVYPGTCRDLTASDRERAIAHGQPYVMRLHVAKAAAHVPALSFLENGTGPSGQHGPIQVTAAALGDIVLARKDIPVAYHLAVVIDDSFQEVSLVTRGSDLFSATHVQRLLQALLGLAVPQYAHHRLILDSQGNKFSKRDQAVTLRSLREQGLSTAQVRARIERL